MEDDSHPAPGDDATWLARAVAQAAHYLPAQGPIAVFVHHNTLHAFEHLPFHEAVVAASRVYETEPYLSETRFRELYANGRVDDSDVTAALEEYWRIRPAAEVAGFSGRDLHRLALLHAVEPLTDCLILWHTREGDALLQFRADVGAEQRARITAKHESEPAALADLWAACQAAFPEEQPPVPMGPVHVQWTHRDGLLQATGEDPNDLVHPILSRFGAAFLDDGSAAWPMPGREQGFFRAWADLVATDAAPLPGWLEGLQDEVVADSYRERGPVAVILDVLADLNLDRSRWGEYLTRLLLHLRGWAGMFHWFESHPQERITCERQVRLIDFLAVRLVYDRRAWAHLAHKHFHFSGALRGLEARLLAEKKELQAEGRGNRWTEAWRMFQLAQLLGLGAEDLQRLGSLDLKALLASLDDFDEMSRRRVWQEAYERHYRNQVLAALASNARQPVAVRHPRAPQQQIVCCIDEREESFRRHLEEHEPSVETFGTAGFFGLPIQYAGLDDGHEVPLCPIVVTPSHVVREVAIDADHPLASQRQQRRRRLHLWRHTSRHASQALVRGTLATPFLGFASALALPSYVLAPRLTARLRDALQRYVLPAPVTRLTGGQAEEEDAAPALGFCLDEQVERVAATLENIGLRDGFARVVCILGHGSVSMNNPHESAHDCGACGGRHGGANARLFADFANRRSVRRGLAQRGIHIPDETVFVGGIHNTSSDAVILFDLDAVPTSHDADLARLRLVLDRARAWSAHERCRRFESAPSRLTPKRALRHVEARAEALSEPRPELGHCTNAACIVGRRSLSRNLFLDRRAFLVSYDPTQDESGAVLERTLAAVGPVGAGISLEYYFSFVDGTGYGCGTKLPHNLVGMLGVMDGPASDLRTGLPKQMIEIHEPMRLLLIVEAETEMLEAIAARQPGIQRLVVNQWIQLISLSPRTGIIRRWTPSGWERLDFGEDTLPRVGSSLSWYEREKDFLPPALIAAAEVSHAA